MRLFLILRLPCANYIIYIYFHTMFVQNGTQRLVNHKAYESNIDA